MIFQWFSLFLTTQMHAQACVCWSKYTKAAYGTKARRSGLSLSTQPFMQITWTEIDGKTDSLYLMFYLAQ